MTIFERDVVFQPPTHGRVFNNLIWGMVPGGAVRGTTVVTKYLTMVVPQFVS